MFMSSKDGVPPIGKNCQKCGQQNSTDVSFCIYCGSVFAQYSSQESSLENQRICPTCKNSIPRTYRFCPNDGSPLDMGIKPPQPSSEMIPPQFQTNKVFVPITPRTNEQQFQEQKISPIQLTKAEIGTYPVPEMFTFSQGAVSTSQRLPGDLRAVQPPPAFSIDAPVPQRTLRRFLALLGISKAPLQVLLTNFIVIEAILFLWVYQRVVVDDSVLIGQVVAIVLLFGLLSAVVFSSPALFIGRMAARILDTELIFRVELTAIMINFGINLLIIPFFPFPILVTAGELKSRSTLPRVEYSKAVYYGVALALGLVAMGAIGTLFFISSFAPYQFSPSARAAILLGFMTTALAQSLNVLPFGTMFGRQIRDAMPRRYLIILFSSFAVLIVALGLVQTLP